MGAWLTIHLKEIKNMITAKSEFYVQRAIKTVSVAKQLAAKWTSQELTPDEMQTQLEAVTGNSSVTPPVIGQMEIESQAERARQNANGLWRAALDDLHQRTVQGLNMAKTKFRNDPASLAVLHGLNAVGHSPEKILAEALAWESAWGKIAATWNPTITNTLAAFKTLRQQAAEDLQTAFSDADALHSEAVAKLEQMCADLEDMNVAWYADATRVFPVGTPEGDMIRSTVPTTYTPSTSTPPPAPVPPATATTTPKSL
jgi:hypothetical protein